MLGKGRGCQIESGADEGGEGLGLGRVEVGAEVQQRGENAAYFLMDDWFDLAVAHVHQKVLQFAVGLGHHRIGQRFVGLAGAELGLSTFGGLAGAWPPRTRRR